jgi:hypothetical protein
MILVKAKRQKGIFKKIIGLIASKEAKPIFFTTRFGIHTFGVKFPIDVLILDSQSKVVKMRRELKPNRFFFWPPRFEKVIELPAGYIKKAHIKIGDRIILEVI